MVKALLALGVLLAVILAGCAGEPAAPAASYACTSFAVYGPRPIYGMNFDYPDVEMRFSLRPEQGRRVFLAEFAQGNGQYASICAANSDGLFATLQMLFPEAALRPARAGEVYTWQLLDHAVRNFSRAEQARAWLREQRLVQYQLSLHNLIADAHGDAFVAEAGEAGNVITTIEGKYLVMTNFPNGSLAGKNYREAQGTGADRYRTAHEYIAANLAAFDVNQALQTLQRTAQGGDYATRSSIVFDPSQGDLYLVLGRDFAHVWRIAVSEGIIETYRGYAQPYRTSLDSSGVLASQLRQPQTLPRAASWSWEWWWLIPAALMVGLGGAWLWRRRKRA